MDAYTYAADLHCETCANDIMFDLDRAGKKPADTDDEFSYDSGDYPKGPTAYGGGEADSPQHCGTCGEFLENDLTSDGVAYIRDAVVEAIRSGRVSDALRVWVEYYGIGLDEVLQHVESTTEKNECPSSA
jgi:hypothetical protein